MNNIVKKCIVCESNNLIKRKSINDFFILTCQDCGFGQLTSLSNEKYKLYNGTENSIAKGNVTNEISIFKDNPKIQERILKYYRFTPLTKTYSVKDIIDDKNSIIYDIGCGAGIFLAILESKGYKNLYGLEYNEDSVNLIKENFQFNIRSSEVKYYTDWPQADLLTSIDVLEHLPDINKSVAEINKIVKLNHYIFIRVPNYGSFFAKLFKSKWIWEIPPYHINYFTKKSLQIIFENNGFEIIENYTKSSGYRFVFFVIQFMKFLKNNSDLETIKSGKINEFKLLLSNIFELFPNLILFPLILYLKIRDIDDCIYLIAKKIK